MNRILISGICLVAVVFCFNVVHAQSSIDIQTLQKLSGLKSTSTSSNPNSQYVNQFQQLLDKNWGQTHPLDYAVFFVTSKVACSDSDYQSLKFYKVIADEYLSLYQIQHSQVGGLCVSSDEFRQDFTSLSSSTLPIVILDKSASTQLLTQKNYLGLYYFPNISGKQSILVCACDNNVESWTGAWVLSHELSHFSLNYYGTPQTISMAWVHYMQYLEYQCQQGNFYKVCPEYSTAVASPSGHQIPVMEIYGKGPTSYNMPPNAPQSDVVISQQTFASTPEFNGVVGVVVLIAVTGVIVITRNSDHF